MVSRVFTSRSIQVVGLDAIQDFVAVSPGYHAALFGSAVTYEAFASVMTIPFGEVVQDTDA